MQQLPRDVWRYRVPTRHVADLRDAQRLAQVGLTLPTPGRVGWPAYQSIGEALWKEGWHGLIAPSAARTDGLVLCLFVEGSGVLPARPLAPPKVVTEPPAPPAGMRT